MRPRVYKHGRFMDKEGVLGALLPLPLTDVLTLQPFAQNLTGLALRWGPRLPQAWPLPQERWQPGGGLAARGLCSCLVPT